MGVFRRTIFNYCVYHYIYHKYVKIILEQYCLKANYEGNVTIFCIIFLAKLREFSIFNDIDKQLIDIDHLGDRHPLY